MVDKEFFEGFSTFEDTSEDSLKYTSGDEALILKIELENRVEELIVHDNEPAEEAVKKFCIKHVLNQEIELALIKKVKESLQPIKVQAMIPTTKPTKFIKKGVFIKKEVPSRGRSVLSITNRNISQSPEKSVNNKCTEEIKDFPESPETKTKTKSKTIHLHNNSTQYFKPRPRQPSNKL